MAPEGFTCDEAENYCFEVEVTRAGQVELTLDFYKIERKTHWSSANGMKANVF